MVPCRFTECHPATTAFLSQKPQTTELPSPEDLWGLLFPPLLFPDALTDLQKLLLLPHSCPHTDKWICINSTVYLNVATRSSLIASKAKKLIAVTCLVLQGISHGPLEEKVAKICICYLVVSVLNWNHIWSSIFFLTFVNLRIFFLNMAGVLIM